mgnify:CR=1 FL=1
MLRSHKYLVADCLEMTFDALYEDPPPQIVVMPEPDFYKCGCGRYTEMIGGRCFVCQIIEREHGRDGLDGL